MSNLQEGVEKRSDCSASDSVNLLDCNVLIRGDRVPSKSAKSRLLGEADRFLVWLHERDCTEATVRGYRWALRDIAVGLCDAGFTMNPRKIGQTEVNWLYHHRYAGCLHDTKVTNLGILQGFLKWAGNKENVAWPRRDNARPNARWLSKDQAMLLKASATGLGRVLVHFGLDLGMRRCEMLRLKVSSFQTGRSNLILVMGKGHGEGKPRMLPWHPDTQEVLDIALALRDKAISGARARGLSFEVPDNLLVYESANGVNPYHKSALDNVLRGVGRNVGIEPLAFHDLRRTFGRMCHDAGIELVGIMQLLGHADTKMTIRYLGLNDNDALANMKTLAAYQKSVEFRKVETDGISQQNGGPCGDHSRLVWLRSQFGLFCT